MSVDGASEAPSGDLVETPDEHVPPADPRVAVWIERARGGDIEAFGEFCQFYRPILRAVALGWLPEEADDLVQEVFLRSWRYHEKIEKPGFLFAVLRNLLLDRREAAERRENAAKRLLEELDIAVPAPVESAMDRRRFFRCFFIARNRLSEEHRVLLDARVRGMTYDGMAETFNGAKRSIERTMQSIRTRVARMMRRCLAGRRG
jgi:RNA polymerase sigma factor (sigma-70 family)